MDGYIDRPTASRISASWFPIYFVGLRQARQAVPSRSRVNSKSIPSHPAPGRYRRRPSAGAGDGERRIRTPQGRLQLPESRDGAKSWSRGDVDRRRRCNSMPSCLNSFLRIGWYQAGENWNSEPPCERHPRPLRRISRREEPLVGLRIEVTSRFPGATGKPQKSLSVAPAGALRTLGGCRREAAQFET